MKKLFFLGVCLVALASQPGQAQAIRPPVVVVQIYYSGLNTGHIAVTRGEGKTEDVDFKDQNTKQHTAAEVFQRVLTQLYEEGYALKSTFTPDKSYVTTLIYEKRP